MRRILNRTISPNRRSLGVPAGQKHGRFGWRRAKRPFALGLLLSGSLALLGCGGATQATPATPSAQPQLSLGQTSVSFPATNVGTTSNETAVVTLANIGNVAISISSIQDSDPSDFPGSTTCPNPGSLAPGTSCTISIQFTPTAPGVLSGQIVISSTNAGSATISLSGAGNAQSSCEITPTGGSDDGFTAGQSTFIVFWNTGQTPVSIDQISLSGDFSLFNGTGGPWPTCSSAPFTLNAGQACNVYVEFTPVGSGNFTGDLNAATSCPTENLITYTFSGSN